MTNEQFEKELEKLGYVKGIKEYQDPRGFQVSVIIRINDFFIEELKKHPYTLGVKLKKRNGTSVGHFWKWSLKQQEELETTEDVLVMINRLVEMTIELERF